MTSPKRAADADEAATNVVKGRFPNARREAERKEARTVAQEFRRRRARIARDVALNVAGEISQRELGRRWPSEWHSYHNMHKARRKGVATVAPEFMTFAGLLSHMGPKSAPTDELDCLDPFAHHYGPRGARWTDHKTNIQNRTITVKVPDPDTGKMIPEAALADKQRISKEAARSRRRRAAKKVPAATPAAAPKRKIAATVAPLQGVIIPAPAGEPPPPPKAAPEHLISATQLEDKWRSAVRKHWPGVQCPERWTVKTKAMALNTFNRSARPPEEFCEFMDWSVQHWRAIVGGTRFGWMKRKTIIPPDVPDIGFFTRHTDGFFETHIRDDVHRWEAEHTSCRIREANAKLAEAKRLHHEAKWLNEETAAIARARGIVIAFHRSETGQRVLREFAGITLQNLPAPAPAVPRRIRDEATLEAELVAHARDLEERPIPPWSDED